MSDRPDWDSYFMAVAALASIRSPDPDTKHGSVVIDDDHRPLSMGYNGFPKRAPDGVYPLTRPEKYPYLPHAEFNCILNSRMRPDDGTLYVTGLPCEKCMLAIIQAGIKRVVYGKIQSACVDTSVSEITFELARNSGIELCEHAVSPIKVLKQVVRYLEQKGWV